MDAVVESAQNRKKNRQEASVSAAEATAAHKLEKMFIRRKARWASFSSTGETDIFAKSWTQLERTNKKNGAAASVCAIL